METARVVFDQISGSCSLAKLTLGYKINHYSRLPGFQSEDLGTLIKRDSIEK